jgi:hypothetical protein
MRTEDIQKDEQRHEQKSNPFLPRFWSLPGVSLVYSIQDSDGSNRN